MNPETETGPQLPEAAPQPPGTVPGYRLAAPAPPGAPGGHLVALADRLDAAGDRAAQEATAWDGDPHRQAEHSGKASGLWEAADIVRSSLPVHGESAQRIATLRHLLREADADRSELRAAVADRNQAVTALQAVRDGLRAQLKSLIQGRRVAAARDIHPMLAHGDLPVGTDQLERILGCRVLISGEERDLPPESGDPR